jgi:hypothetical protein
MAAQQARFDQFQQEYNKEHPDAALDGRTPSALYRPSQRLCTEQLPEPGYRKHFLLRWVSRAENFRMHNCQVFTTIALVGETLGFEETDDGIWTVYFCNYHLGPLHERDYRLHG